MKAIERSRKRQEDPAYFERKKSANLDGWPPRASSILKVNHMIHRGLVETFASCHSCFEQAENEFACHRCSNSMLIWDQNQAAMDSLESWTRRRSIREGSRSTLVDARVLRAQIWLDLSRGHQYRENARNFWFQRNERSTHHSPVRDWGGNSSDVSTLVIARKTWLWSQMGLPHV